MVYERHERAQSGSSCVVGNPDILLPIIAPWHDDTTLRVQHGAATIVNEKCSAWAPLPGHTKTALREYVIV